MYCTIIEKQCKKVSRSYVCRKIQWRSYDWDPLQGIWDQEDEIPREPREKWNIVLNKSVRSAGKIIKKQWHITTVKYWDIVGGYFSEHIWCGIERAFPETKTDGELCQSYVRLIYDKFQVVIDRVQEEYEKTEEYRVKTQNEKLKKAKADEIKQEKKYRDEKYSLDSLFGPGYYDAHYNRDGSYNSKGAREWEKTHKDQEYRNDHSSYSSSFNFDFMKSSSFSGPEKAMAEELITTGYKQLAKKYHPDVGGTNAQFQKLGDIKENLLKKI